jgi:alpha-L-fucosidase
MRYITITSKHHDGFAMWATKQSKWNIVDATPFPRDPLKELADECRRQGIKLFFYHSQLDWTHPDYYPLGRTGHASGRTASGDFNKYLDFMDAQLTELLTNYGEIGGIWFDGMWDKPKADWRLRQTYDLIHKLQPSAMVGSNHHVEPYPGEDFQMFEKDLPGQNTAGFSQTSHVDRVLPLESCDTINGAWGYNASDKRFKSTRQLIHYLVRAAGHDANFLLNVGPRPDGTIQPEFVERLKEIGAWLRTHGESIYGTRGGPVSPRPWGATTQKDGKIYVHVLDWSDEVLALPPMKGMRSAKLMGAGTAVGLQQVEGATLLRIPPGSRDPIDTVIVLEP